MKLKYITVLALGPALLVSSCSVFEGSTKRVSYKEEPVEKPEVETPVAKPEVKKNKTEEKRQPASQKPKTDKQKHTVAAATSHQSVKTVGEKITTGDYKRIEGEWAIMSVYGENITGDEHPTIIFESESHRFYGNNGCNTINGDFTIPGVDKLLLSNVATTMMLCPDAKFEYKINQALGNVAAFELTVKGQDSYLVMKSVKGVKLMTLHRSDIGFVNGAWQVVAVNGDRMAVNDDMRLVIDVPEGKVHGSAGCNMLNGHVLVDAEQSNSIQFTSLMTTRMTCPDQSLETSLLLALENVTLCFKDGSNHVVLRDASGKELVKLRRLSLDELSR